MTIFAETAVCMTLACGAVARGARRQDDQPFSAATMPLQGNDFTAVETGVDEVIRTDIGSVKGVSRVETNRWNNTILVNVFIEPFEYSVRQQIYAKELQLFDSFPDLYFDVNVLPSEL
jgi:hypothetical protein